MTIALPNAPPSTRRARTKLLQMQATTTKAQIVAVATTKMTPPLIRGGVQHRKRKVHIQKWPVYSNPLPFSLFVIFCVLMLCGPAFAVWRVSADVFFQKALVVSFASSIMHCVFVKWEKSIGKFSAGVSFSSILINWRIFS